MSNAAQQTRMIPYPVIEAAVHGETDAVNEVIRHYSTESSDSVYISYALQKDRP